jgi:hypothetical protein
MLREVVEASDSESEDETGFEPSAADDDLPRERYFRYLQKYANRTQEQGMAGTSASQPPVASSQEGYDDRDWACFWLRLGGFSSAVVADDEGWTALHHAMQTTVHWKKAYRVVRGLLPQMDRQWLRAKTSGGRPQGWTALHLAANGSDVMLKRSHLIALLIEHEADVNCRDEKGRTPFLHAAATGCVDSAKALSQGGADEQAVNNDGRNAADLCLHSSGLMTRCLLLRGVVSLR